MVQILDTTLRDGSYVANFQFSSADTSIIAGELDRCGVPFIEIGHGLGLGAGNEKFPAPRASDYEHLEAAAQAIQNSKWGTFLIPGIGDLDALRRAADQGMSFVRVGTDVTTAKEAEEAIRCAKDLGLIAACNLMKTYAVDSRQVAEIADFVKDWGTDYLYVVDSAGGMLPDDVEDYFTAIRQTTDIPLGFHGHDNLGLAVANSLRAIDCGASIIDVSLRGMGRDAGNAPTENLLFILKRQGKLQDIDPYSILDLAERKIDPILHSVGRDQSISVVSGFAQFHSSYLGDVQNFAAEHDLDTLRLIPAVCEIDKVTVTHDALERGAANLTENHQPSTKQQRRAMPRAASWPHDIVAQALQVAIEAQSIAVKFNLCSVFNLVQSLRPETGTFVSPTIHQGPEFVVASAEVNSPEVAATIANAVKSDVGHILLDCDRKRADSGAIVANVLEAASQSSILRYSDFAVWAKSIALLVNERLSSSNSHRVAILGDGDLPDACRDSFNLFLPDVRVFSTLLGTPAKSIDALVLFGNAENLVNVQDIIVPGGLIVDGAIGSIPRQTISILSEAGMQVFRPEMRFVIQSEISALVRVQNFLREGVGSGEIDDIPIAAGGQIAPRGTVVVDSISNPSREFGVADGRGFLIQDADLTPEDRMNLQKIKALVG